jgi:hypothetical protein
MQELIGKSKNGVSVTYDPVNSHAATHLKDTPQLKALVIEALQDMTLEDDTIMTDVDMGRVVGTTDVVKTDSTDEIVYGMRKNRTDDGHVPFTKSRPGDPCSHITLQVVRQNDGTYILTSVWIGQLHINESGKEDDEPFPNSPNATSRSKELWSKRAFVYGSQEIIPGTETSACPW